MVAKASSNNALHPTASSLCSSNGNPQSGRGLPLPIAGVDDHKAALFVFCDRHCNGK